MDAVVNAAFPIFGLILTGFAAAKAGLLDRVGTDNLNRFAISLALPALIFVVMAKVRPSEVAQPGFAAAFAGGIAASFAIAWTFSAIRGRRPADRAIEGLNASYANAGFMGLPLCLLVFGEESLPASTVAMLLTACALFLFTIVLIEADLRRGASPLNTVRRVGFALLRNPLLLAPVFGLALAGTGIALPLPVDRFLTLLGGAASPVALVCIGLFLGQEGVIRDLRTVGALVALKLVGQPAVTALLALYVFDMPPLWAKVAILSAALPVGTGPFTLAKLYGLEPSATSGAILLSHLVSVGTVSVLIAWLA